MCIITSWINTLIHSWKMESTFPPLQQKVVSLQTVVGLRRAADRWHMWSQQLLHLPICETDFSLLCSCFTVLPPTVQLLCPTDRSYTSIITRTKTCSTNQVRDTETKKILKVFVLVGLNFISTDKGRKKINYWLRKWHWTVRYLNHPSLQGIFPHMEIFCWQFLSIINSIHFCNFLNGKLKFNC